MLYNLAMMGLMGAGGIDSLNDVMLALAMLSGATWTLQLGDLFIAIALVMLFFEILKATRNGSGSLLNHMLSMLVFIAYLVEFLLVTECGDANFLHPDDRRLHRRHRRIHHFDPLGRAGCFDRAVVATYPAVGEGWHVSASEGA